MKNASVSILTSTNPSSLKHLSSIVMSPTQGLISPTKMLSPSPIDKTSAVQSFRSDLDLPSIRQTHTIKQTMESSKNKLEDIQAPRKSIPDMKVIEINKSLSSPSLKKSKIGRPHNTLSQILNTVGRTSISEANTLYKAESPNDPKIVEKIQDKMDYTFKQKERINPNISGPARNIEAMKAKLNALNAYSYISDELSGVTRIKNSEEKLAKINSINLSKQTSEGDLKKALTKNGRGASTSNKYLQIPLYLKIYDGHKDDEIPVKDRLVSIISHEIDAITTKYTSTKMTNGGDIITSFRNEPTSLQKPSSPSLISPKSKPSILVNRRTFLGKKGIVSNEEKARFSNFLKNQFVNDLIEERNEREGKNKKDTKPISIEDLKKDIVENRGFKNRHANMIDGLDENFLEEFRKKQRNNDRTEKVEVPLGLALSKNFVIFTPDNSDILESSFRKKREDSRSPSPLRTVDQRRFSLTNNIQDIKQSTVESKDNKKELSERKELKLDAQESKRTISSNKGDLSTTKGDKFKELREKLKNKLIKWGKLEMTLSQVYFLLRKLIIR